MRGRGTGNEIAIGSDGIRHCLLPILENGAVKVARELFPELLLWLNDPGDVCTGAGCDITPVGLRDAASAKYSHFYGLT